MATQIRLRSLRREDYPGDAPAWLDVLLGSLTQFMGDVGDSLGELNGLLDGGLTFKENFAAELRTIEVTMPAEFPTWHLVGGAGEPAFQSGWANFDATTFNPVSFRMWPDGIVELRGFAKQPSPSANASTIFTLPAGYRPPLNSRFNVLGSDAAGLFVVAPAVVQINPGTGAVVFNEGKPHNAGWLMLDDIQFQANGTAAKADAFAAPFPLTIKTAGGFTPVTVDIIQVVDKTTAGVVPGVLGPYRADWKADGTNVVINAIWGLQPGRKYDVTFLITAG